MYTYEKKDKQGILKIKISKENWEKAVNEVYEKTKGKFTVQGFRKGKAPKKVIEQTYGDTVFFDDAFENVINEEYNKFLTENKGIVPASYTRVQMDSFTAQTHKLMPKLKESAKSRLALLKKTKFAKMATLQQLIFQARLMALNLMAELQKTIV